MAKTGGTKLIANNKKARHDYFVEETVEAGIVLFGTEVKSMRQGHCSIKEAFQPELILLFWIDFFLLKADCSSSGCLLHFFIFP